MNTHETSPIDNPIFRLDPDALRGPAEPFRQLREDTPVGWLDSVGCFVVSRYDDIVGVLRQPQLFSSSKASGPRSVTGIAGAVADDDSYPDEVRAMARRRIELASHPILIYADPPLHVRQRQLVNHAFTPRRVREIEDPIRSIADRLVTAWERREVIAFQSAFGILLPMTVIAGALGVPEGHWEAFRRWSDASVAGLGNPNLGREGIIEVLTSVNEFYDYFQAQVDARRARHHDDLIGDIVAARLDGEQPLTDPEILQALLQLLVAGNETTANLIAAMVFRLAREPRWQERLRADRSAIPRFVEESLRLETPAQGLFRIATADTEVGGTPIPAGCLLFLEYAAANRDPALCPHGDALDVDTKLNGQHLAFGFGEHYCLGASLARAEARVALETLFDRLDSFELADPDATEQYLPNFGIRSLRPFAIRVAYH